ncbi:DUF1801 domain-containing protein [Patescibacteria group bacterium]
MPSIKTVLTKERGAIEEVILLYQGERNYDNVKVGEWSAKDNLAHIVFWHESFARNVSDLVVGREPKPVEGALWEANERGVKVNKKHKVPALLKRLEKAQVVIERNISNKKIKMIPYRKGTHDYSPVEHLDVVHDHVRGHIDGVKKAMRHEAAEYIEKQKSPQKEILKRVRNIIVRALPGTDERQEWGVVTFDNGRFYIAAMKERVHIGFAIAGLSKKEIEEFDGGGKTMRHLKISTLKDVDAKKIRRLVKLVHEKSPRLTK